MRAVEHAHEVRVSAHLRAMPFLWVAVDDAPGPRSRRAAIEAGAIALLSNLGNPSADPPSSDWLGHFADRPAVRESGLWNVNHVSSGYDPGFLDTLEAAVRSS